MEMPIDWRNYRRFFGLAFRDNPTAKRVARWAVLALLFPAMNLAANVCLALDHVLFPGFRRAVVETPVFIVGHPRSGTTLMHNLLARDRERFTWFMLYELTMPSILQKKLVRWIGALDREYWNGGLERRIRAWEDRAFAKGRQMHPFGLTMPEEDAFLMVPTFLQCQVGFFFPYMKESARLYAMDEWSEPRDVRNRERLMHFYREAIRRQIYLDGGVDGRSRDAGDGGVDGRSRDAGDGGVDGRSRDAGDGGEGRDAAAGRPAKVFLSKNPTFTGTIATLADAFPDARFVVMMRNPYQTIPSLLKMMVRNWKMMGYERHEISESLDVLAQQALHHYRYPFEALADLPPERAAFVDYRELVANPAKTIGALYAQLGFAMSDAYAETLDEEEKRSREHRAEHVYSLDEFGLTRGEIRDALPEAFERYGWTAPESTE